MKHRAQEDPSENGFLAENFHPSKHRDANFAFHKLIKTYFLARKQRKNSLILSKPAFFLFIGSHRKSRLQCLTL